MRSQSSEASIAQLPQLCADPVTSAATLIHVPDALLLRTSSGVGQTVPAACGWAGGALLALLPHGPLTAALRTAGADGQPVSAYAIRHVLDPDGWPRPTGRLDCHGTARAIPGWFRRPAALIMWHRHPHPGLLSAVADDGWLLVEFAVRHATWTGPDAVSDLVPHLLCTQRSEAIVAP